MCIRDRWLLSSPPVLLPTELMLSVALGGARFTGLLDLAGFLAWWWWCFFLDLASEELELEELELEELEELELLEDDELLEDELELLEEELEELEEELLLLLPEEELLSTGLRTS